MILLMMINWFMIKFQDSFSLNMIMLNKLNNYILMIMMFIFLLIIYLNIFIFMNNFLNKFLIDNKIMEILWTIFPFILIFFISKESMKILYFNNDLKKNLLNIKILSNQWFWYYEFLNINLKFNSYMIMKNNFDFYLLETDNSLILPFNYNIQIILSSNDVIHSWSIPSLNIKMDCIPNQINMLNFKIIKSSILYGQCSEICGINHSFMPIKIEAIKLKDFLNWIKYLIYMLIF